MKKVLPCPGLLLGQLEARVRHGRTLPRHGRSPMAIHRARASDSAIGRPDASLDRLCNADRSRAGLRAGAAPACALWRTGVAAGAGPIAVYRDQLDEIAAEQARGLLGVAEADAARLEISRRILAAASTGEAQPPAAANMLRAFLEPRHATLALATAIAVPLLTAGLYAVYGAPQILSGETESTREAARITSLVAQVEERLRAAPGDGKGWEVIAPVYLRAGPVCRSSGRLCQGRAPARRHPRAAGRARRGLHARRRRRRHT